MIFDGRWTYTLCRHVTLRDAVRAGYESDESNPYFYFFYFSSSPSKAHFCKSNMKLIKRNISAKDGSGSIMLRPDTPEDLWHAYNLLQKGDLVEVDKRLHKLVETNIKSAASWPIPPKSLLINYRTLQVSLIEDIRFTNLFPHYPFWLDLNTLMKYYER